MAVLSFRPSDRAPGGPSPTELRCHCGSLMARMTMRGIELKCRRCKRLIVVATDRARQGWVAVAAHAEDTMRR